MLSNIVLVPVGHRDDGADGVVEHAHPVDGPRRAARPRHGGLHDDVRRDGADRRADRRRAGASDRRTDHRRRRRRAHDPRRDRVRGPAAVAARRGAAAHHRAAVRRRRDARAGDGDGRGVRRLLRPSPSGRGGREAAGEGRAVARNAICAKAAPLIRRYAPPSPAGRRSVGAARAPPASHRDFTMPGLRPAPRSAAPTHRGSRRSAGTRRRPDRRSASARGVWRRARRGSPGRRSRRR